MPKRTTQRFVRFLKYVKKWFEEDRRRIKNLQTELENARKDRDAAVGHNHAIEALLEGAKSKIFGLERENEFLKQERERTLRLEHELHLMREEAHRDHLTKLYNRRGKEVQFDRVRSILARMFGNKRGQALREHEGLAPLPKQNESNLVRIRIGKAHAEMAVIRIDLDNFKVVNDTHGHAAGDGVLMAFAENLRKTFIRDQDILCRDGGDEFVVILPNTLPGQAGPLCERLQAYMRSDDRFTFSDGLQVTASVGIAEVLYEHEDSLREALHKADQALYASKQNGKDQVSVSAA